MMRRPISFRLAAGVFAGWLALLLADAPALHPCPMHDVPPAGVWAGARAPSAMAGMAMPGDPAGATTAPASGAHPAHVHGCTCLGACAAGVMALVAAPPALVSAASLLARVATAPASPAPLRRPAPHLLPFAQAPPSLA